MTVPRSPAPGTAPPEQSGPDALAAEQEQPWLRLDKRMLLVHPVDEAVKLLPVLLISLVVGTQSGNHYWGLIALSVLVAYAIARWFTTSYRIGPVHVQLRTGVFQRKVLSVPRNRIRSVDVEAGLLHRVLGLSVVRIGTGQRAEKPGESARFELNALDARLVPALREALLFTHGATDSPEASDPTQAPRGVEIAHWSPSWVRYAPLSTTGVLTVAAAIGLVFQYGLGQRVADSDTISEGLDVLRGWGVAAAVTIGVVALVAIASALACVRYLLTFGNLTVTDDGRVLHVSHGLLRTRQTTLDRARLRGTSLREPLLLRLAGAARLDAVMTGVSADQRFSSLLLPQAPRPEVQRVESLVLRSRDATPLHSHGPAAQRRRYSRALLPVVVLAAAVGVADTAGAPIGWQVWTAVAILAVAAGLLAHDRYRGLGHATPPGRLVTRHGSLDRGRHTVDADGIVAWTVRQTFFQRRAGVATVIAATPAGTGHYDVLDLPAQEAWSLVETVTPGAGDIWTRRN
ncbi:PH domain-containing protein [Rhodococcus sp. Q]|uniref:PH domain-containing protein n=1 Tax=Rhodococcus sp. Q TaxID=2502252 RepID=UPI0010F52075|nr:PH domain-containing protein [Rhodococcus sp. Q]